MDGFFSNGVFCFETGAATDVGCRRQINEDNLISRPEFGLWTVADGMGGHAAGDFASTTIVQELGSIGVAASDFSELIGRVPSKKLRVLRGGLARALSMRTRPGR